MTTNELSARQLREREFYDAYSSHHEGERVDLAPIEGKPSRPWNPYWHLFALAQNRFRPGARLLDFGCGWGTNTAVFAKMGYDVTGFDISEGNLRVARKLMTEMGVADRVHLSVQSAEALKYPDNTFDTIVGVDILHHVEIDTAISECRRVLRPGGVAFFREPVESPYFDALRNTRLVRAVFPNDPSFDRHVTSDERKLTHDDILRMQRIFPGCRVEYFRVLSRLAVLTKGRGETSLERADRAARIVPGFRHFAGTIVLSLTKPDR